MKRFKAWNRSRRGYSRQDMSLAISNAVEATLGDFAKVVHRVAHGTLSQEDYSEFCERLDFALSVEAARLKADGPISTREIPS